MIEPGQVWRANRGTTRLRILKVWDTAVTVTNLKGQNQRGLHITDLQARYQIES